MAAATIRTVDTVWDALLLFWPGCNTAAPASPAPERVGAACRRLGLFLRDVADTGRPSLPDRYHALCRSSPPVDGSGPRHWPRRTSPNGCQKAAAPSTWRQVHLRQRHRPARLLGIDPDAAYPSIEIPLTPGTVLAFYPDGLVETPGADLDDAMAGLAIQLAPASLAPAHGPARHNPDRPCTANRPRTDDVALLLIGLATAE